MLKPYFILSLGLFLTLYLPFSFANTVIGWVEHTQVFLNGQTVALEAKIDSGADHTSLHAKHIESFTKDNQNWVRFQTVQHINIELPLLKRTQIKTKSKGYQSRPVVLIKLCIDGLVREVEANLVDRNHFSKPLLIGRSALPGFLIDPNKTYLTKKTECTF